MSESFEEKYPDLVPIEQFHARAVQFLVDGQEWDAASSLLSCHLGQLSVSHVNYEAYGGYGYEIAVNIRLIAPRPIFDKLDHFGDEGLKNQVRKAFEVVIPERYVFRGFELRAKVANPGPNWQTDLMQAIEGKAVHNQAVESSSVVVWKNMRFRSASEMRIAEALDRIGIMFLPNCKAAVGEMDRRENREPDFLICHEGKWGILEVDGEPFHPPSRTVQDHERDRLFRDHGIRVVEHFDASECFENADSVVARFLDILNKAYK